MIKLADAVQHNAGVSEVCALVGISRQLYHYYFNNNSVFREKMTTTKDNQDMLVSEFLDKMVAYSVALAVFLRAWVLVKPEQKYYGAHNLTN